MAGNDELRAAHGGRPGAGGDRFSAAGGSGNHLRVVPGPQATAERPSPLDEWASLKMQHIRAEALGWLDMRGEARGDVAAALRQIAVDALAAAMSLEELIDDHRAAMRARLDHVRRRALSP